jgi:hypothetical protein
VTFTDAERGGQTTLLVRLAVLVVVILAACTSTPPPPTESAAQVVPGKGFIPVGVDPNTVPKIPVQVGPATQHSPDASKVALYVRNDSTSTANTAVVIDGTMTAGGGFWSQDIGVECDAMPPGAQLALLDRGISEPGASVVRVLYVRDDEPEAPSLWVVVGTSGAITTGRGVPSWWTGDPLC